MTTSTIRHDPNARQFVADVDGNRAHLDYTLADGVMTITHTRVPPAIGGRGIAAELMAAALDAARTARVVGGSRLFLRRGVYGAGTAKVPTSSMWMNFWTRRWTSPFRPATRRRWAARD